MRELLSCYLFLLIAFLVGCATKPEPPRDPVVITRDVDRIVRVTCPDRRPTAPDYPDDDDDLLKVQLFRADGSFDPTSLFELAQKYRAARPLYRQRLLEDDEQIKACAANN